MKPHSFFPPHAFASHPQDSSHSRHTHHSHHLPVPTMTHARRPRIAVLLAAVAAVPALFAGSSAFAQEAAPTIRPQQSITDRVGEPLAEQPAAASDVASAYKFRAGAALTNAYFFRGYNQEDQGFIAQPFAELGISLFNSKVVNPDEPSKYSVNATVGTFNSIHSQKTLSSGSGPSDWYESDQYAGLTLTTGRFTVGALYTFYTFPNGSARTIGEVSGNLGYAIPLAGDATDPGDVDVNLKLGAIVAYETNDHNPDAVATNVNGQNDAYLEFDVTPEVAFETGGTDFTLTFPFAVGASLKNYYQDANGSDDFFGYFTVSAVVGVPIPLPKAYGAWKLSGGVQYLYLNANVLQAVNNDNQSQLNGSVTLELSF